MAKVDLTWNNALSLKKLTNISCLCWKSSRNISAYNSICQKLRNWKQKINNFLIFYFFFR